MEWSSTKLPVTAQPCKITAVCLAGLGGGREEAERELWLLKVPCADPLLHLGSAAHPSVFPWHSEGASQGDTAPHKRGGLSDGGDNKRTCCKSCQPYEHQAYDCTNSMVLSRVLGRGSWRILGGPGCVVRAASPHLPGMQAKLWAFLIQRAAFPFESGAPLPLQRNCLLLNKRLLVIF